MRAERYTLSRMRADIARDIDTYLEFAGQYHPVPVTLRRRMSALAMPSVIACALYRASHWFYCAGWRRAALALARLNLLLTRASIHPASAIGPGMYMPHPATGVVFQGRAGTGLKLFAGAAVCAAEQTPLHGDELTSAPRLGDDVALGARAYVRGPVEIGCGARIGFNACVRSDIPAGATVFSQTLLNRVRRREDTPSATGVR